MLNEAQAFYWKWFWFKHCDFLSRNPGGFSLSATHWWDAVALGPGGIIMSALRGFGKDGLVCIVLLKIPFSSSVNWVVPHQHWVKLHSWRRLLNSEMTLWRTCASQEGPSVLKILQGLPWPSWGGYSTFRERIRSPEPCLCSAAIATCGGINSWWLLGLTVRVFLWDKKEFFPVLSSAMLITSHSFFLGYQKAVKYSECCAESRYVLSVALKHCKEEYRIS